MLGLIMYTFVTMVGGNPTGHAYGFTYWKNPVRDASAYRYCLSLTNALFLLTGLFRRTSRPGRYRPVPRTAILHGSSLLHVRRSI